MKAGIICVLLICAWPGAYGQVITDLSKPISYNNVTVTNTTRCSGFTEYAQTISGAGNICTLETNHYSDCGSWMVGDKVRLGAAPQTTINPSLLGKLTLTSSNTPVYQYQYKCNSTSSYNVNDGTGDDEDSRMIMDVAGNLWRTARKAIIGGAPSPGGAVTISEAANYSGGKPNWQSYPTTIAKDTGTGCSGVACDYRDPMPTSMPNGDIFVTWVVKDPTTGLAQPMMSTIRSHATGLWSKPALMNLPNPPGFKQFVPLACAARPFFSVGDYPACVVTAIPTIGSGSTTTHIYYTTDNGQTWAWFRQIFSAGTLPDIEIGLSCVSNCEVQSVNAKWIGFERKDGRCPYTNPQICPLAWFYSTNNGQSWNGPYNTDFPIITSPTDPHLASDHSVSPSLYCNVGNPLFTVPATSIPSGSCIITWGERYVLTGTGTYWRLEQLTFNPLRAISGGSTYFSGTNPQTVLTDSVQGVTLAGYQSMAFYGMDGVLIEWLDANYINPVAPLNIFEMYGKFQAAAGLPDVGKNTTRK